MRRFLVLAAALAALALPACGGSSAGKGSPPDSAPPADSPSPPDAAAVDVLRGGPPRADMSARVERALAPDASARADGSSARCGACPAGYACGSANGLPVCRSPAGVPLFRHVWLIVMENTTLATLDADPTVVPYITGLEHAWASGSDYHGVAHPSLPNYLAMTGGNTFGVSCDCHPSGSACGFCFTPGFDSCACDQPASTANLADQLEGAALGWKAYGEGMGVPCNLVDDSCAHYAAKHVPFLYFDDVQGNAARCAAHVVDYSTFATDLASAGGPPVFSFIAPNLVDDMHDPQPSTTTNLMDGDTWLSKNVPPLADPLMATSKWFQQGSLLVIVWDEDDNSGGLSGTDDPIPILVLSPYAKQGGYVSATRADHYSLLATVEDGLGLPRLGNAASAQPLSDYFPAK